MAQHILPPAVWVFMLVLRLHCRPHWMGSALFVPSTHISEHRHLHCDQLNPLRMIYQPSWYFLQDIMPSSGGRGWTLPGGASHCGIKSNTLCIKQELYHVYLRHKPVIAPLWQHAELGAQFNNNLVFYTFINKDTRAYGLIHRQRNGLDLRVTGFISHTRKAADAFLEQTVPLWVVRNKLE